MRSTMQAFGGIALGLAIGMIAIAICWWHEREPQ